MSMWEKLVYSVSIAYLLLAGELFLLQFVVWSFDLTLPGWLRMLISGSKLYVFIINCIVCYVILFKPWRRRGQFKDKEDEIKVVYTGAVLSPEYIHSGLWRPSIESETYSYHNLVPHGYGKITYLLDDEIIEEYEGEFDTGEYHGEGKMIFKGRQHCGRFQNGALIFR